MVNFTSICTSFTYQDKKKYAKIYRERILRENAWNTRKYKENRGYTKLCEKNKSAHGLPRQDLPDMIKSLISSHNPRF